MKKLIVILGTVTPLLYGCATTGSNSSYDASQYGQKQHLNTVVLNNIYLSAQDIQNSLNSLNGVEKSRYASSGLPLENVSAPDLEHKELSVNWYGPIEPLLKQITDLVGYKLQVYGKEPPTAIIINLGSSIKNEKASALAILRNIDIQSKTQAKLYVDPENKVISLRYTNYAAS
ncbi:DotD/TraH family lipoprotein [Thiotrichales bacterium 19S11-10]|nr:DotD/TraH family lipoprotein [Thiotrichales bacterium 19S11-10]MCF6807288.1 DotD/TraH family lipoprotein [Thiotrichales bacterium 19S9-11]MCF6811257.1 DotD/TraH family lipoprotein [Thiotrichales bacterium 19S9-12]